MNRAEWLEAAREFVLAFVRDNPARHWSGNDLWTAGLPATSNRRDLSVVLLRLEAEGSIRRTGRREESVGGHGQPILRWEAA